MLWLPQRSTGRRWRSAIGHRGAALTQGSIGVHAVATGKLCKSGG
jgi:hypothetical protein